MAYRNKEEKIKEIFRVNYPNFSILEGPVMIDGPNVNSYNFLIKTEQGEFVFREYASFQLYHNKEHLKATLDVISKLKQLGSKVPEIILTKDQNSLLEIGGKNYTCFVYIDHEENPKLSNVLKSDIAKNLAILHKNLKEVYNDFYDNKNGMRLELPEVPKLSNQSREVISGLYSYPLEEFLYDLQEAYNILRDNFPEEKLLVQQLIHADFHPGNILSLNQKVKAIIDFDAMHPSQRIREVCFAALRFCSTREEFLRFIDVYDQENSLSDYEKKCIDFFVLIEPFRRACKIMFIYETKRQDNWLHDLPKQIDSLKKAKSFLDI